MGVCYIVGAGDFHGSFTPAKDDLVIAADGGYLALMERGIRCDILLGDMDSLSELGVASSDCKAPEILKFPVEKDETDTHLAYLEGARRGYTEFYIYGGTGGREDHTFANYSLLLYGQNILCLVLHLLFQLYLHFVLVIYFHLVFLILLLY